MESIESTRKGLCGDNLLQLELWIASKARVHADQHRKQIFLHTSVHFNGL